MASGTLVFLIIGAIGILLLTVALLGVELFDLDSGDSVLSTEVIAGFIGALGFGGAIANELIGGGSPVQVAAAAGIGLAAAFPAAWLAFRLTRAAGDMPTDATPTRADLAGTLGVVVTPIPAAGYGEVRLRIGGQPVKVNARADTAIPLGAAVFVVEALSETSVLVEQTSHLIEGSS